MSASLPNLIIVMPDELRQQAVGLTKTDPVITPNLDKFSKEALNLTNAISNCPICSPARAMLFTGKFPVSNGVTDNCYSKTTEFDIQLKETDRCLSDVLQDSGYSQGYIGKFHLDSPNEKDAEYTEGWRGNPENGGTLWDAYTPPGPRRHGFNFWYSYGCCDNHLSPHYWLNDAKVNERTDVDAWSVEHETGVAIDYIRNTDNEYRDENKPFFLMVAHNPPHMPFHAVPEKYKSLYAEKPPKELLNRQNVDFDTPAASSVSSYFAAITGIDENFGRLLNTLEEENLEEDTIVIFMSDHGELMGSHGRMGKNAWQDEALLIPFMIRWKGKISHGKEEVFFNMPDVMPTLLGLIGLGNMIPQGVEGSDYSSIIKGEKQNKPESAYYLTAQPFFPEERRGIKTNEFTFVSILEKSSGKLSYVLHNNVTDPYQLQNIFSNEDKLAKRFKSELIKWFVKTNDVAWLTKDEFMGLKNLGFIGVIKRFFLILMSKFNKARVSN